MSRDEKRDQPETPEPDDAVTSTDPQEKEPQSDAETSNEEPAPVTPEDDSEPGDGDSEADSEPSGRKALRNRAQSAEARVTELEAQVAQLQEQVSSAQKQTVARIAESQRRPDFPAVLGASLHDGNHLFQNAGYDVDAFLGEDGTVNPELVAAVVQEILAQNPALGRKASPAPDPSLGSSARNTQAPGDAWQQLMQRTR